MVVSIYTLIVILVIGDGSIYIAPRPFLSEHECRTAFTEYQEHNPHALVACVPATGVMQIELNKPVS